MKMIDVPSGWMYGFPKELPDHIQTDKDIREWILKNGYPKSEMKELGDQFYYRMWEQEEKTLNSAFVADLNSTPDSIMCVLLVSLPEEYRLMKNEVRKIMSKRRQKRLMESGVFND